jgi:hypothetical protein
MVASRELDAIVAEKVMGWSYTRFMNNVHRVSARHPVWQEFIVVPRYSTDLAAAWQVVEKLATGYRNVLIENTAELLGKRRYWVDIKEHGDLGMIDIAKANADTAPLAICLAALKAVGVEIPLDTQ